MGKKVIVIGAGLGGLTAAYRLQQAGYSVQVLERGAGPGGRVQTLAMNGYLLDTGADALTDGYVEYRQLAEELGVGDLAVFTASEMGVLRNGRVISFDPSRALSMAMTPLLSWGAKLRLLKGVITLRRDALGLMTSRLHERAHLDDPVLSASQLSRAVFGEETANYLIDPVTKLYNGTNAARCSALDVYIGLAVASHRPMALRGGQVALPRAIAARLSVGYGATVTSVAYDADGRVRVCYEDSAAAPRQITVDGCVIATMYENAEHIYPALKEHCGSVGQGIIKMALIKVHLAYKVRTTSNAYLVQVPDSEDPDLYCLFLDHNKCADRAPAGCSLIAAYTTNEATARYLHHTDEELTAWARTRVETLMPELRGQFDFSLVSRWPYMAQASYPGYYRKAAAALRKLPGDAPIQLCCDVFTKCGQETSVACGNSAAATLIGALGDARDADASPAMARMV